ncbi:MAG: ABC transporter permease [Anaerolineae bacterium]|nr:ABC transporter permease [Anaerolineae bacterium]
MQTTYFTDLHIHRDLLFAWTLRTIRARYQQSILGGLWAILQPVAMVAIFSIVFTLFVPVDTGGLPYVVFSYTAMVPWLLFATSVTDMVDCLVVNMALVSKIYFPREILPIAALLARLLDFGIASTVLVLLMLYYQIPFFSFGLVYLPLVLTIQLLLALGLGLAGSALNVFFRDVRYLFILGLQLWFYATPIIYPVLLVPEHLRPFYFLNPMAGVIAAYRAILLDQEMPGSYLFASAPTALVLFLIGYWFFKRLEFQFADVV